MTEPVVIEGWRCEVFASGVRYAKGPDGLGATFTRAGMSCDATILPPRILAWLIRPLLREAWEQGWNQAAAEMQGRSETKPNPYEDQ